MKKIITSALVAVTAFAALSACGTDTSSNAAGKASQVATSDTTKAPVAPKATVAPPKATVAQENAIESAQSYLAMSGFSRAGVIQQLTSTAGEGFKMADAVYAINHIRVDWNTEAVESAKSYLELSAFSRAGLIEQLCSKAGDQYTIAQSTYAVTQVGL